MNIFSTYLFFVSVFLKMKNGHKLSMAKKVHEVYPYRILVGIKIIWFFRYFRDIGLVGDYNLATFFFY